MKKQEPDLLFVELKEPGAVRRDVLMATKDVLDCLKRYEEFKALKAQKQQALDRLNRIVADLQSLNRRLRNKMPRAPVTVKEEAAWEKEGVVEKFKTGSLPSAARPKSKLDILQEELAKIEERLGALE
jgi:hypothetical protein